MRSLSVLKLKNVLKQNLMMSSLFSDLLNTHLLYFPFKRGKNAESPIMTKTIIIRYRNHESNIRFPPPWSLNMWSRVLLSLIWFLWNMQRYRLIILLSSSKLVTVIFFKNLLKNSRAFVCDVQFGDNWSSTSRTTKTICNFVNPDQCNL